MSKQESKHFARLWTYVTRAADDAFAECDEDFINKCRVSRKDPVAWKNAAEKEYRNLRCELELQCYGSTDRERTLDSSKTAAVICCTLMRKKALSFDEEQALGLLVENEAELGSNKFPDRIAFNHWIVDNYFVNYKIAYLAGLRIMFETLLGELLHDEATREYGRKLADMGRLQRYPVRPKFDNFDVNMVMGLGRADISSQEVSTFFLASQYYQIEMYTCLALGLNQPEEAT